MINTLVGPCEGHHIGSKYLTVEFLHGDQVQGLQRVPGWCNEIQAGMNPGVVVIEQGSLDLQLLLQVGFKLRIDIFYYRLVAEEREDMAERKPGYSLLEQHRSLGGCSAHYGNKCCSWDPPCPTYSLSFASVCFHLVHSMSIVDIFAR